MESAGGLSDGGAELRGGRVSALAKKMGLGQQRPAGGNNFNRRPCEIFKQRTKLSRSRRALRPRFCYQFPALFKIKGAGNAGRPMRPPVSVCNGSG